MATRVSRSKTHVVMQSTHQANFEVTVTVSHRMTNALVDGFMTMGHTIENIPGAFSAADDSSCNKNVADNLSYQQNATTFFSELISLSTTDIFPRCKEASFLNEAKGSSLAYGHELSVTKSDECTSEGRADSEKLYSYVKINQIWQAFVKQLNIVISNMAASHAKIHQFVAEAHKELDLYQAQFDNALITTQSQVGSLKTDMKKAIV